MIVAEHICGINTIYKDLNKDLLKGLLHHGFENVSYVYELIIINSGNESEFNIIFQRDGDPVLDSVKIIHVENMGWNATGGYPPIDKFLLETLLNYKSYIRDNKLEQIGI